MDTVAPPAGVMTLRAAASEAMKKDATLCSDDTRSQRKKDLGEDCLMVIVLQTGPVSLLKSLHTQAVAGDLTRSVSAVPNGDLISSYIISISCLVLRCLRKETLMPRQ